MATRGVQQSMQLWNSMTVLATLRSSRCGKNVPAVLTMPGDAATEVIIHSLCLKFFLYEMATDCARTQKFVVYSSSQDLFRDVKWLRSHDTRLSAFMTRVRFRKSAFPLSKIDSRDR